MIRSNRSQLTGYRPADARSATHAYIMTIDGHDWGLRTMGSDDNDTPSPVARPLQLSAGQRERLTRLLHDVLAG